MVNRRRGFGVCLAAGLVIASVAGCNRLPQLQQAQQAPKLPDPFDGVQKTDLTPHDPQPIEDTRAPGRVSRPASYYGSEVKLDSAPARQDAAGEGYELNFENAAVSTVAKVVLGDILGVGYTIDPRVQGTVTIASGRPVPKADLVLVLENALRMSNVVLVNDSGGGYRIIPSGDAQGAGTTARAGDDAVGYGISVVPLHYTSAQAMFKLLDSFAIKAGMARADSGHNLILIQGTGPERQAAVDAILSFDVDWMRGQSVGIYPVEYATPEAIIKELEKIMETGDDGLNHHLVTLQTIARLNAVLVVTRKPNLLKTAAMWISRLDKADNAGASVRVYRLHYGDARQVAKVLNDLFGLRSSSGLDSAVNQIAPGAGVSTISSGVGGAGGLAALGGTSGSGLPGAGGTGSGIGGSTTGLGSTAGQPGGLGSSSGLGSAGGLGGSGGLGTGGVGASAGFGGTGSAMSGFGGQRGGTQGGLQQSGAIVLPGVRIAPDVVNNALVIFANQENYRLISQTLAQLDRPQLQVAIHATIVEVTLNNDLQYGVQYYLSNNSTAFGLTSTMQASPLAAVVPGANLLLGGLATPKVVINALRAITDVKVLSSPSLVVLDNEVASLQVGDQVPVSTGTASVLASATTQSNTIVNSISYLNTGVILTVRPRINVNGNVILNIDQAISNVANNANASTLTPTVSQREVKSSVAVASGQTVLLGGLITETQSRTRSGIPVLEEIPGLGDLFSTNDRSTARTELIIFIQPQIIRNSVDASKVAEELRAKLRGSADSAFPPGPSLRGDPQFVR